MFFFLLPRDREQSHFIRLISEERSAVMSIFSENTSQHQTLCDLVSHRNYQPKAQFPSTI